jgi:hypothetical protein
MDLYTLSIWGKYGCHPKRSEGSHRPKISVLSYLVLLKLNPAPYDVEMD